MADIKKKLGTDKAADFAGFLLGEKQLEKKPLTLQEAEHLSAAFSQQFFECGQADNQAELTYAKVPYSNPGGGYCQYLSDIMSLSMKEMGYASEQVVIAGVDSHGRPALELATDYAGDGDIETQLSYKYNMHIAHKIQIQAEGEIQEHVIDPSMSQNKAKLWSLEDWQKQLYKGPVEYKSLAEMKEIFEIEEQATRYEQKAYSYPHGKVFLFSMSRDAPRAPIVSSDKVFELEASPPESSIPGLDMAASYLKYGVPQLSGLVSDDINHTLAATIRQEYAAGFDAERFTRALQSNPRQPLSQTVLDAFSKNFPKLHKSFAATLTEDQRLAFYTIMPAQKKSPSRRRANR